MWTCPKCGEKIEDNIQQCWSCSELHPLVSEIQNEQDESFRISHEKQLEAHEDGMKTNKGVREANEVSMKANQRFIEVLDLQMENEKRISKLLDKVDPLIDLLTNKLKS